MKKFIVIIQTNRNFELLVLEAKDKNELRPLYVDKGMTVSIYEYNENNLRWAKYDLKNLNELWNRA